MKFIFALQPVESLLHFRDKAGSEAMMEAIHLFWLVEDANQFLGEGRSLGLAILKFKAALDRHTLISKIMILTQNEAYQSLKNTQNLIVLLAKTYRQNDEALAILADFAYWYESRLNRYAGLTHEKRQLLGINWMISKKSEWLLPKPKWSTRFYTDCNSFLRVLVPIR